MSDFRINLPFAKVDAERRLVGGWATVEEPDRQGKVVDYETAKAAMLAWGGNMREMHRDTMAVGKAVEVTPDDANKRIWLESYVSKSADGENTWIKIQEDILTGYSIAGSLSHRSPEIHKDAAGKVIANQREFVKDIAEVSYVDLPAAPSATFQFVKAQGLTPDAAFIADLDPSTDEPDFIAQQLREQAAAKAANPETPGDDMSKTVKAADPITPADSAAPVATEVIDAAPLPEAVIAGVASEIAAAVPAAKAAVPAAPEVPAPAPDASAPSTTLAKSAADDVLSAHYILEQIDRLIETEAADGESDQVAKLRAARTSVAEFETAEAAEVGTPEDAAVAEAEKPVEVVVVADYSYYAATIGDLIKRGIITQADLQAPLEGEAAIAKAAPLDSEAIAKTVTPLLEGFAKATDLSAIKDDLTAIGRQVAEIAKAASNVGPLKYVERNGRLVSLDAGADTYSVDEAAVLEKAANASTNPLVRESLGKAAAAADIRKMLG